MARGFAGGGGHSLFALGAVGLVALHEFVRHAAGGADDFRLFHDGDLSAGAEGVIPGRLHFRREDVDAVVLDAVGGMAVGIASGFKGQLVARHGPADAFADPVVARAVALDATGSANEVGDVSGAAADAQAGGGSLTIAENGSVEVLRRDENITARVNAAVGIHGGAPGAVALIEGLGGERAPADVVVILAPANPGGRPLVAGNPDPAALAALRPASVVIASPAERLVGSPHPAGVAGIPAAAGVGPP